LLARVELGAGVTSGGLNWMAIVSASADGSG
jgi:hypothetical protein